MKNLLLTAVATLGLTATTIAQLPNNIPTNNLEVYYSFVNSANDHFNNCNGVVNGASATNDANGNPNSAYSFNGSTEYINIPAEFVNGQTLSSQTFRVKFKINLPGNYTLWNKDGFWRETAIYLQTDNSIGLFWAFPNYYSVIRTNSGSIQLGVWNDVFIIVSNNSASVFINGVQQSSYQEYSVTSSNISYSNLGSCGTQYGNNRFGFSKTSCSPINYHMGEIDEFGLWSRVLTQQEITNLYTSQLPTQTSLCLPSITTNVPTSIGIDSVIVGGNITNDGGSSIVLRGVCYSTTPNPNMGNMRTEDGSGVGSFSTILRNLNPSTTYYVRSYAKNPNGVVVYGDEVSFSTSSITIGSFYSGGIVFDLDSTGQHGMVSTPNNLGIFHWGCYGTDITNTSIALGTGESNTTYIMAGCSERPIAASVCADLVLNGYSDWYLPSRDELMMMLDRLHRQGIGGFSHEWYWSSSQINHNGAWAINFNIDGPGGGGMSFMNKSANFGIFRVRGVRTF
jgi:hypothetical protein